MEQPTTTAKSKRGLGWPWNNTAPEFAPYNPAIASGKISWLFNWEMWKPDGTPSSSADTGAGFDYVPQVRTAAQAPQIDQFLTPRGDQLTHFLAFNEPEITSQANLSVADAVALWTQYVLPAKAKFGFRLGSPGMSSDPAKGKPWLQEFLAALEQQQQQKGGVDGDGIDFIVVHWYGTQVEQLASFLGDMHQTFGKPLWLTEFACTSMRADAPVTTGQVEEFVKQALPFLDGCEFVERYAYFGAMKSVGDWVGEASCLHGKDGAGLTAVGKLYSEL